MRVCSLCSLTYHTVSRIDSIFILSASKMYKQEKVYFVLLPDKEDNWPGFFIIIILALVQKRRKKTWKLTFTSCIKIKCYQHSHNNHNENRTHDPINHLMRVLVYIFICGNDKVKQPRNKNQPSQTGIAYLGTALQNSDKSTSIFYHMQ